jgi:glutamyl-tRNA reductase
MKLWITGLSHKTAPVEVRERLAIAEPAVPGALKLLKSRPAVSEALILSTCNRVEWYVVTGEESDPRDAIQGFLRETRLADPEELQPYLYEFAGRDAVHHVFRVASSLDSMVLGEPQILGQLKTAYALAKAHGGIAGTLDIVMTRAFNVAKRVRSETGIGQMAVSVSYAAVELARKIFGSLQGRSVLLIGAGKMSELAARHLRRSGASAIFVTNRTYERALEMAKVFQGVALDYAGLVEFLPRMDIVVTSTGSASYILTRADMQQVISARRNRPVFLIDIAVPRNIDPAVNQLDNVYLYDIDDLQEVVNSNLRERQKEARRAEELVEEEVGRLMQRLNAQAVAPTIVSLQEQLEQIRRAEIERLRGKLGSLTPQQQEALEALTRGIVNKIAHGPISELRRRAGDPEGIHVIDAIRRVFHLK